MDNSDDPTLKLIELQSKRKDVIKGIITLPAVSTRLQVNERIKQLEKLIGEFKTTHDEILSKGKPDIPYIVLGTGTAFIELVEKAIMELRNTKVIMAPNTLDSETLSAGFSGAGKSNEQSIRIKKLEYKINQLMHSITSTKEELSTVDMLSKEVFDFKNKLFCDQWASISSLEEDIVINQTGTENEHNPEICRAVMKHLNDVVKIMSSKITKSNHGNNSQNVISSKLPDLKIQVFKGNLLKWQAFKELYDGCIHNKNNLTNVEKMEYLKSLLDGEPRRLINAFTLSANNYLDAYEVLRKRYDNKRKLLTIHLDNMCKPIGKVATAEAVKELHDCINDGMTSIRNMGIDNSSWGPIIVHLSIACLDTESRSQFEQKYHDRDQDIPELSDFLTFLEGRYKTLEIMAPLKVSPSSNSNSVKSNVANDAKGKDGKSPQSCVKCNEAHKLFLCPKFLALSPKSRYRFVKSVSLCINCLQKHGSKKCESNKTCKKCAKAHNSLLHFDSNEPSANQANICQDVASNPSVLTSSCNTMEVMATALTLVRDIYGNPFKIRILIDTGAQGNFITESLVQKLRLQKIPYQTEVTGIGRTKAHNVKHAVECNLEPMYPSNYDFPIRALVMGKSLTSATPEKLITEQLPADWPPLQLADQTFRNPGDIDLIAGISFFTKILIPETYRSNESGLVAMNSKLGWLIFGEVKEKYDAYKTIKSMISVEQMRDNLSKFWELEEIPRASMLTKEEIDCEKHFESTHKRRSDGKYEVEIPFKVGIDEADLSTSEKRAICRFYTLESKLKSNENFALEYKRFIHEYLSLGHMALVTDNNDEDNEVYYMPHHAVVKADSSTTKLRVVFDASAKTQSNFSLNQLMMCAPKLQDDLSTILLRWRKYRYVMTADIEKMYRQIFVAPKHQKYLRILWRDAPEEPIRTYQLTTVTYGTTAAPYLAVKTLQTLAEDESGFHPDASKVMIRDFYVDDLLTGADTVERCLDLRNGLVGILEKGGFNLRKWSSNCQQILAGIPEENVSQELLNINEEVGNPNIKTLGLIWEPMDDCFKFKVSPLNFDNVKKTKRNLSSDVSKIFDPLGLLAPITITAKMLFQQTWRTKLHWNDELPQQITNAWFNFRSTLPDIELIKIPRWLDLTDESEIVLHGFCDASESAYAAALYVTSTSPDNKVSTRLLMSKTKVAPIKQHLTVAKLELCGAQLLAKLYSYIVKSFGWQEKQFFAWCDSKITLTWISGEPSRWKTFVANRVSEIKSLAPHAEWRYVPTKENCADCATRGLTPKQLLHFNLWWNGPHWLALPNHQWPKQDSDSENNSMLEIPEQRKSQVLTVRSTQEDNIESIIKRFSEFTTLKSVIAYCLRFIHNCTSNTRMTEIVSSQELQSAENVIIREIQLIHFPDEIRCLLQGEPISRNSRLKSLSPFLDDDKIIRVTGRLENAPISESEKHPIILPRSTYLSRLIVLDSHLRSKHGLHSLTEYITRRKFWIIKCKDLVKSVIFHCVKCNRRSPRTSFQFMGQLPAARVTLNNAFYYTGVDYAGPLDIKAWKGRCNKIHKCYICVFVCLTTQAIHLEVVTDLTAEAFLAAYRRFSSRRGPCFHLFSDCGSNFIGACNIMETELEAFNQQWLKNIKPLTNDGIEWHFNPPATPHAGGIWEAGVKSVKNLLYKYFGKALSTYEELNTLLVQIKGCLNSRPLGLMRNTPEDQFILTPSHFLNGVPLFSHPEPEPEKVLLATRWKFIQHLKSEFAREFKMLMLHKLQPRRKWQTISPNLNTNDIVIVEDHLQPSHKWPIGIIAKTYPGDDGLVRVVDVKMESGRVLKRPVTKVSLLPILDQPETVDSAPPQPLPAGNELENSSPVHVNRKKTTYKNSTVGLWIGFLMTTIFLSSLGAQAADVQKIKHNPGLMFAKMGNLRMSTSSWKILLYFNMTNFYNELNNLETSTELFRESCKEHGFISTYCSAVYTDIRQHLDEILEDNTILMDMNHNVQETLRERQGKRSITSLLPFVGTLSRAAFGTLDEQYAREIEMVINSMKADDNHPLSLIRNQTSVMETFLQQGRLSEEKTAQQFSWVSSHLESIENEINRMQSETTVGMKLQFIGSHIMYRTQHLFSLQTALIDAISSCHHGKVQGILHPSMLKKQLMLIKSSTKSDSLVPVTSDNMIRLYSLLSVKTRISNNMLIFHFSIPLIKARQYELYKVISLPFHLEKNMVLIRPSFEYVAVSLHRDRYMDISSKDLSECDYLDDNTSICQEHSPEYKNNPNIQSCEMKIFLGEQFDKTLCKTLILEELDQMWLQLPMPRKWIFSIANTEQFNMICGQEVSILKLEGVGTIQLEEGCSLEHKTFSIPVSEEIQSEVTASLYVPAIDISTIDDYHSTRVKVNQSSIMLKRSSHWDRIDDSISIIKHQQYLKAATLSTHISIGTLSFTIAIFVLSGVTALVFWVKKKYFKKPIPLPRSKVFQYHDDCVNEIGEPSRRNTGDSSAAAHIAVKRELPGGPTLDDISFS